MSWNQSAGIPEILPNHTSDWLEIQNITIMEKEFSRGRSAQDIIISLILVVFGAILVAMPTSQSVNILGFFMIFAGLILLFVLRTCYKLDGTKETFKKKEIYFAQSKRDSTAAAIASDPAAIDLADENKGNGLRVDIFYNRKSGKAYCRLFEYVPYRYEPCTPYYEYSIEKVEKLLK